MAEYLSPGTFVENVVNSGASIESVSASTGGFIGILPKGPVGKAVLVTSWTNFISKFALGLDTPFMANSDLVYALYGFFQNGGTRAYIIRVTGAGSAKATASIISGETTAVTFSAKDEGAWANAMKLRVSANANDDTRFDVKIYLGTDLVESFVSLSNSNADEKYFIDVLNNASGMISALAGSLAPTTTAVSFSGGSDNLEAITDTVYTDALQAFNLADDVNLLAIPGQTSEVVTKALAAYADSRETFAIFDAPKSSTVETVKTFRKLFSSEHGALYFPWLKVSDPISKTGKLRECPTSGHIMGVYARIINKRGVWKAPAGTEAVVMGAVDLMTTLTKSDCDVLNPLSINAIIAKPNYGIVVWGARSLSTDSTFRYVPQILLNLNIRKSIDTGTQWAVFEPNDHQLWARVVTTIQSYLDTLWRSGAFFGESAKEAYLVVCDEELNPEASRKQGKLITQVAYADKDTAEFIIFKVSHSMSS
jgi:phage tail sheath protein FI